MLSGRYKSTFREATHILCNGNLNDPSFRSICSQKIISLNVKSIVTDIGKYEINNKNNKEYVVVIYENFFGKQKTEGHPFKNENEVDEKKD